MIYKDEKALKEYFDLLNQNEIIFGDSQNAIILEYKEESCIIVFESNDFFQEKIIKDNEALGTDIKFLDFKFTKRDFELLNLFDTNIHYNKISLQIFDFDLYLKTVSNYLETASDEDSFLNFFYKKF